MSSLAMIVALNRPGFAGEKILRGKASSFRQEAKVAMKFAFCETFLKVVGFQLRISFASSLILIVITRDENQITITQIFVFLWHAEAWLSEAWPLQILHLSRNESDRAARLTEIRTINCWWHTIHTSFQQSWWVKSSRTVWTVVPEIIEDVNSLPAADQLVT